MFLLDVHQYIHTSLYTSVFNFWSFDYILFPSYDWYKKWETSGNNCQIIFCLWGMSRFLRCAACCRCTFGAGCKLSFAASYSIPGNWDQMLLEVKTCTRSNLEAFILWGCLVKPCSHSKWAWVQRWWWIRLVKAPKAGSWLLPSPGSDCRLAHFLFIWGRSQSNWQTSSRSRGEGIMC